MNFVYELLRAGTTVNNADSGSEVARKINQNFSNVSDALDELNAKIDAGGGGGAIRKITIGGEEQPIEDYTVDIPVAGESLGAIKSSDGENKISIDDDGSAEVNSLNVNKLVQDDGDYIVFDGKNS